MKINKFKNLVIIIFIVLGVVIAFIFINNFTNEKKMSTKIIEYINNNCDKNNKCEISMQDITDFKWDKMLIYQVGSSNKEISDLLGVKFYDSLDLASGIIFVYKNKIIYKEQQIYNPEKPDRLLLYIGTMYGQAKYGVFTPNDALFEGSRYKLNGNMYFEIAPTN